MPALLELNEPKQVIVEGNDDLRLFRYLASHLDILNIEVRHYGGIDNLRPFLRTLTTTPGFTSISSLAVVADANSSRESRVQKIQDALSNAGLPAPDAPLEIASDGSTQVAYLVVPHKRGSGMIEDVCLDSVRTDPVMECIDGYFECIEFSGASGPRETWAAKARLHAFLASRERPDLRLGEAAEAGIWQLEDDSFAPLRQLLRMI